MKNKSLKTVLVAICLMFFAIVIISSSILFSTVIPQSHASGTTDTNYTSYDIDSENYVVKYSAENYNFGDSVVVTLSVYIEGKGLNDCGHSQLGIYSIDGNLFDDSLPTEKWVNVTTQTKVVMENNQPYISIVIKNGNGQTVRIANQVEISDGLFADTLLGGATLYMLPCVSAEQNQSYVIVTPENKVVVIDGGNVDDAEYLVEFLYGIKNKVDVWFLSHFHQDHIGAISEILKNDEIYIENLYYDFPSDDDLAQYATAVTSELKNLRANINKVGTVHTTQAGQIIELDSGINLEILNTWQAYTNNFGNNTTVVVRLNTPAEDVLFLGDAGVELGEYLLGIEANVRGCAIVQLAHHGQNGVNKAFYRAIGSKIWLYSCPEWLWTGNVDFKYFTNASLDIENVREWSRDLNVIYKLISKDGLQKIV